VLRLVSAGKPEPPAGFEPAPPDGFDPVFSAVPFTFWVECHDRFDCKQHVECSSAPAPAPPIDYLARDYASFRRLMLDRMSVVAPDWRERNAADLGIALVEMLAYVADQLSYRQDAVATEAYLGTARRRVSARRHARLVDYTMHDGCNARTWMQVRVTADIVQPETPGSRAALAKGTLLLTRVEGQAGRLPPGSRAIEDAPAVFETVGDVYKLYAAHNEMKFYTWGATECCLPKGSTSATLRGDYGDTLRPGEVLVFEEILGPRTGVAEDADRRHRQAVRLVGVQSAVDPVGTGGAPVGVTEIIWHAEDALRFPLCISSRGDRGYLDDVSVASGNIVLADHGRTLPGEELVVVPAPQLDYASVAAGACAPGKADPVPPRYRPRLSRAPITQVCPDPFAEDRQGELVSAAAAMRSSPDRAVPAVRLAGGENGRQPVDWTARLDLLNSHADAPEFVVEVEDGGAGILRFGDGEHGMAPLSGTLFAATYRVGNGATGNIPADALAHIVTDDGRIERVRNPLPGWGGAEPETIEHVRQNAPAAFRTQERAVTPEDYERAAERLPGTQRVAATPRWTGSWPTMFVTVDRTGGAHDDSGFPGRVLGHLERFRMAGHDLEVDGPRFVSLDIEMEVCVAGGYFRSDVEQELLRVFSARDLPDGRRGAFHPDNFTFGGTVYLSPLYLAAQQVAGVEWVQVTSFRRQSRPSDTEALDTGRLTLGRLEIARLDNDPSDPERGLFRLHLRGGT
jgi:hypothetical protein